MLLERISYERGLPFQIEVINIAEENAHYHSEAEILLVLRGSTRIKNNHLSYLLQTGDSYIVDAEDLHQIFDSSEDILLVSLQINLEFFADIYPNIDFMIFVCEFSADKLTGRPYSFENKRDILKCTSITMKKSLLNIWRSWSI